MGFLELIFGGRKKKIQHYLSNGASILDVRTQREVNSGNIKGSIHIPLQELHTRYSELNPDASYIVVCQSGVRSAKAAKFLNINNFDAINGGGWQSLKVLLNN